VMLAIGKGLDVKKAILIGNSGWHVVYTYIDVGHGFLCDSGNKESEIKQDKLTRLFSVKKQQSA